MLFVFENIDYKKRRYLNARKAAGSETQHKSALTYFCQILWSLWNKISSKNSFLVVSETLRLFVNILTSNDKYSRKVKASV